ncbi:sugar phosphate nucleotidyltransferase [Aquabacterium sp. A7-Y]|uniref:sugar phosphate nucleotidyltransferase n=1 Tax=Aquabacterium sp. A7-Y TaxID=1349605 RepID=UPI00223DBAA5|nr:sugar phosphate nucleotidyltransferase [Aquabacterium sp. A7-Y]MCW7536379.1 sugar phosphate nucleotidyltransferase [Aquabacterium sp. A7-Y]
MKLPACLRRVLGGDKRAELPQPPRRGLTLRRALIPLGGAEPVGWSALRALPVELLPVVDRPLIHYAINEALAAGIDELVFVVERSHEAVDEQLDAELAVLPGGVKAHVLRPGGEGGLARALASARPLLEDDAFALLLPAEFLQGEPGVLAQMAAQFPRTPGSMVAVEAAGAGTSATAALWVETAVSDLRLACVRAVGQGRPAGAQGPQARIWTAAGRCVFTPRVFANLEPLRHGARTRSPGLRDALAATLLTEPVFAFRYTGRRFDCAAPLSWLEANLVQASRHPQVAGEFQHLLRQTAQFVPASEDLSQVQARALPLPGRAVTGRPRLTLVRN